MSGATSALWAPAGGRTWLFPTLLVIGSIGTATAAIAGNGSLIVAVAPILTVALLAGVWVAPMRVTLLGLIFLGLAVDVTGEGPSDSPLAPIGRLLLDNLKKTIPVNAFTFPVVAVVLGYLLLIHIHRVLTASTIDGVSHTTTARPLFWALGLSFLTVIALIALGVKGGGGGDLQMAKNQVQTFVLLLLMAYLLSMSLRDTRDYNVLGRLILAAAFIKTLMTFWVWYTIEPPPSYATSHGDSMLFASAATLLIARFAEQPVRRNAVLCLVMLPLLVGAMIVNNRRIVWLEVGAAVLILSVVSRQTRLKLRVARATLAAIPLVLVYVAAGWDSQAKVFAPVAMLRSVGDADVDRSTLFRDFENFNLLATLRANPFLGTGFGVPYLEAVKGDDISFFKEYRFLPHNSVLGLWGSGGMFGFTCLSMVLVVGVLFASRSYYWARSPDDRVAAITALALVAIYLVQAWGDVGFSEKRSIFLVSAALAMAGQLAVSTGAWDARASKGAIASRRR